MSSTSNWLRTYGLSRHIDIGYKVGAIKLANFLHKHDASFNIKETKLSFYFDSTADRVSVLFRDVPITFSIPVNRPAAKVAHHNLTILLPYIPLVIV